VQSHIRHADQRQILAQLDQARSLLSANRDSPAYQKINLSYANLFRMWADG
jgi:predicted 2-oxoglutarate/Fe(II)-dependent dioxygenase YbiX